MEITLINSRDRLRQVLSFSSLYDNKMYPTDIDFFFEFKNKGYLIGEIKHVSKLEIPRGQRLAIERAVDDFNSMGKLSVAFLAYHDIVNPEEDVDVSECLISEYRAYGEWIKVKTEITVGTLLERFKKLLKTGH